jgi:hypothetical protein
MGVKPNRSEWLKRNQKVQPVPTETPLTSEPQAKAVVAADLLKSAHPLYGAFQSWCIDKGVDSSRRQATKFLQAHPSYRTASPA